MTARVILAAEQFLSDFVALSNYKIISYIGIPYGVLI